MINPLNPLPHGSRAKHEVVDTSKRRRKSLQSDLPRNAPNSGENLGCDFGRTEMDSFEVKTQVQDNDAVVIDEIASAETSDVDVRFGPDSDGDASVAPIDRAIRAADAMAHHVAQAFGNRRAVIDGALAVAYPLSLHLVGNEDGCRVLVSHRFYMDELKRGQSFTPNPKKPALTAVQFVLRPQDDAERKACSEYANMLDYAAAHAIPPDDYADRMRTVTLRDAKQFGRQRRKEAREANREVGERGADETESNIDTPNEMTDTLPDGTFSEPIPALRVVVNDGESAEVSIAFELHPSIVASFRKQVMQRSAEASLHEFLLDLSALAEELQSSAT